MEASSVGELKQLKYATIYEFMSTRLCTFRKKYFSLCFGPFRPHANVFFLFFLTPAELKTWSITALVADAHRCSVFNITHLSRNRFIFSGAAKGKSNSLHVLTTFFSGIRHIVYRHLVVWHSWLQLRGAERCQRLLCGRDRRKKYPYTCGGRSALKRKCLSDQLMRPTLTNATINEVA